MSNDIFVIAEQMDGNVAEISFEMVGKAKELAAAFGGQAVAVVLGGNVPAELFASALPYMWMMPRSRSSILKHMEKSSKHWLKRNHRDLSCSVGQPQAWISPRGSRRVW